jgi:WD40 repeat protein
MKLVSRYRRLTCVVALLAVVLSGCALVLEYVPGSKEEEPDPSMIAQWIPDDSEQFQSDTDFFVQPQAFSPTLGAPSTSVNWTRSDRSGRILVVGGLDEIAVFDTHSGFLVRRFPGSGPLAVSPDGRYVVSRDSRDSETAVVWDVATGNTVGSLTEKRRPEDSWTRRGQGLEGTDGISLNPAAWSNDGRTFATAFGSNRIVAMDLCSGTVITYFDRMGQRISAMAYSPDGSFLVAGTINGLLQLWNLETGKIESRLEVGSRIVDMRFVGGDLSLVYVTGEAEIHSATILTPDQEIAVIQPIRSRSLPTTPRFLSA